MKAGFVTLFGRSNVGKSTLLNTVVGTKVAITSPKPQTTRNQLQGVLHAPEGQIVFVDTPGIFTSARDKLTKHLNRTAKDALKEIDVIVHVVDPTRMIGPEDKQIMAIIKSVDVPKILVINKMDLHKPTYLAAFEAMEDDYDAMIKLSAKSGAHVKSLTNAIFDLLPEGEALYEQGQVTNLHNEFWFAELIREKLFLRLGQELPYSLTVNVDEIERRKDNTLYVKARIITNAERYKRMIIGKGGRGVKEIGQSARKELETVTGNKVYLDLNVEVNPHWTENLR